jgi:hypothetical protein
MARERTERDGKRCSARARGLKAGAGLRGPYGTSVRHSWPTWILLVPAIILVSTMSLLLPPFAPIFPKELSAQTRSAMRACVLSLPFHPIPLPRLLGLPSSPLTSVCYSIEIFRKSFAYSTVINVCRPISRLHSRRGAYEYATTIRRRSLARAEGMLLFQRTGTRSAFQFYYPVRYDLDNEILGGVFRPPSELHSTIIEIRMERTSRAAAVARSCR